MFMIKISVNFKGVDIVQLQLFCCGFKVQNVCVCACCVGWKNFQLASKNITRHSEVGIVLSFKIILKLTFFWHHYGRAIHRVEHISVDIQSSSEIRINLKSVCIWGFIIYPFPSMNPSHLRVANANQHVLSELSNLAQIMMSS